MAPKCQESMHIKPTPPAVKLKFAASIIRSLHGTFPAKESMQESQCGKSCNQLTKGSIGPMFAPRRDARGISLHHTIALATSSSSTSEPEFKDDISLMSVLKRASISHSLVHMQRLNGPKRAVCNANIEISKPAVPVTATAICFIQAPWCNSSSKAAEVQMYDIRTGTVHIKPPF